VAIGVGVTAVSRGEADPPSCAPFGDAGCFFGENWDNGGTSGWAANAPANFSNTAPGFNGTSRAAKLHYAGTDNGIWADTSVRHTSQQGDVVYIEFYLKFSPGFIWGMGCCNDHFKTFEIQFDPSDRILLVIAGANPTATQGKLEWSIYPNTSSGGTGREVYDQSTTGTSFVVVGGVEYRVVTAIKIARGLGGYLKTWMNGQLVVDAQGVQTTRSTGPVTWNFVRIGGQYAAALSSADAWYDQIRITTTSLAPNSQPPAPPSTLQVR
jgi:hypothetical protein